MNNLCNNKEQDYFVIESVSNEGVMMSAEEAGARAALLFHKDNTVEIMIMGDAMKTVWNDEKNTITIEGEDYPYLLDGDVLKFGISGSLDEDPWMFRRSDEEPPAFDIEGSDSDSDSSAKTPSGGGTAEVSITDGFVTGRMTAVCPDGWKSFSTSLLPGSITMLPLRDMDDEPDITVLYILKEAAQSEDFYDEGNTVIVKIFDNGAVKVRGKADKALLEQVLATVQLTWDAKQSALAICEGREEDFFKIRSITQYGVTQTLDSLKIFGNDNDSILFRKDGTVHANLTFANWLIGNLVEGTWNDNVMTFTDGVSEEGLAYKAKMQKYKEMGVDLPPEGGSATFTLEGDVLTVGIEDKTIVFGRNNDEIPENLRW